MSITNATSDLPGRKYKDKYGNCWENIIEVQSGSGVTLHRKSIDCSELDPEKPGDGTGNIGIPNPGYGGGGAVGA